MKSLRVLIIGVVSAAVAYGAAVTYAFIGSIGSTTAWIVLLAGVLLPVALLSVRRRVWNPLTQLERGIQRVSEGDLSAHIRVAREDELGHLITHFNEMTRVLRDRAEEQGRFAAAGELLGRRWPVSGCWWWTMRSSFAAPCCAF
jgi:HAMP domain-containing protein